MAAGKNKIIKKARKERKIVQEFVESRKQIKIHKFLDGRTANKGVLFSLIVFILLGLLFALYFTAERQKTSFDSTAFESSAFRKVSDKFENLENNFSVLSSSDAEKGVDERILPFVYDIDGNKITFNAKIPNSQARIDSYLETLNAFRVFVEDVEYSNEFDSMNADVNVLTPGSWGGSDKNVSFVIEPQCGNVMIADENIFRVDFSCGEGFDFNTVEKIDLNVALTVLHDFNSLSCTFNGSSICPQDSFNAGDSRPFASITFLDVNCFSCNLSQKTVSTHFNPETESSVKLECLGSYCISPDFDMNFSNFLMLAFPGNAANFSLSMDLNSEITGFNFKDVNISVENRAFNSRKWSGS